MSADASREIDALLESTGEADEALRAVVAHLAARPGVSWAGIAFVEEGKLTIGPWAGEPDETARFRVPVTFQGDLVGEVLVDGDGDAGLLAHVAKAIAPHVLVGWDTGGDVWDP
jgi:hypothetical protein